MTVAAVTPALLVVTGDVFSLLGNCRCDAWCHESAAKNCCPDFLGLPCARRWLSEQHPNVLDRQLNVIPRELTVPDQHALCETQIAG